RGPCPSAQFFDAASHKTFTTADEGDFDHRRKEGLMTRKWRIVGAAVAFAAVAATAGVAVAQYERSDIDGLAPFLANDTCPQAFDLSGTWFRAYSTTQTPRHHNNHPLSFRPDV